MSELEKAQELVNKFIDFAPEQLLSQAKKIATIVVDEIIFEISHDIKFDWVIEREGGEEEIVYWKKVKTEIQNIV